MAVISLASARPWRCLAAGIIVGALAMAGCSSGTAPRAHGGGSAKVALKFQVKGDTAGHGRPKTLTCDPAGGSQPAAASACSVLLNLKKNPFAPIAKETNCPMLLLSNKKILVTGTWFGHQIHRLVVDGGCDIALFKSLSKIGLAS
jgi:hypothetical protein